MTTNPAVGFIGFGEAGFHIADGLRKAGIERISAYDIHTHSPDLGARIQERARQSQVFLLETPSDLAESSEILFSTVTSSSALKAAKQISSFLMPRHTYADLNSVSPGLKQEIEKVIEASGAGFVEAAVMSPVPPHGHRVPMLLGGSSAAAFAERMGPLGMRMEVLPGKVGKAAAVKMCRSVVVKGLEALLFECVLGASRYDADDRVFASLNESFPGLDWKKLADYMVSRVVLHGERRAREMEEVAETLQAIGIEPIMATAAARRQDWSAQLDLRAQFGPEGPRTYREVLDIIENLTGA